MVLLIFNHFRSAISWHAGLHIASILQEDTEIFLLMECQIFFSVRMFLDVFFYDRKFSKIELFCSFSKCSILALKLPSCKYTKKTATMLSKLWLSWRNFENRTDLGGGGGGGMSSFFEEIYIGVQASKSHFFFKGTLKTFLLMTF